MNKRLDRRSFLRGSAGVAVALPLLPELTGAVARAQAQPPRRLITLFFGLGLDPEWQRDFEGPLEPYRGLADKMTFASVNMGQGHAGGAHCETSTVVFVGERQQSENVAGGPSLDQRVRRAVDPSAPTLASGLWWRRGACDAQALRVYNADGSSRPPIKRPSQVFQRVFASTTTPVGSGGEGAASDSARVREQHTRRSVLDTVLAQIRHYAGDRSPLGVDSKLKMEQHLSSLREIERQLAPADEVIEMMEGGQTPSSAAACQFPEQPVDPAIADYDRFTYGTGDGAPQIDWRDFQRVFRLHADLWAMALRCDLVRYGNLMFESAGGHTNLGGTYSALGESTSFPGTSQHDSYFHGNQPDRARLYQHFAQSNLAYFLEQLDDAEHLEANDGSVLDNSCVVIGTEYGWNHSKRNAMHAIAGGGGRFRAGNFTSRVLNCIDLYNAVLTAYGLEANVGQSTGVDSEGDGGVLLA